MVSRTVSGQVTVFQAVHTTVSTKPTGFTAAATRLSARCDAPVHLRSARKHRPRRSQLPPPNGPLLCIRSMRRTSKHAKREEAQAAAQSASSPCLPPFATTPPLSSLRLPAPPPLFILHPPPPLPPPPHTPCTFPPAASTAAGWPSRLAAPFASPGPAPTPFTATTAHAAFGLTPAASTGPGVVTALLELKSMLDSGHLTVGEFQAAKHQLLGV